MVAPTLLAPTSTPSIGPSVCEVTLPVSAEGDDGVSAITRATNALPSKAVPTRIAARRFTLLMTHLLLNQFHASASFSGWPTTGRVPRRTVPQGRTAAKEGPGDAFRCFAGPYLYLTDDPVSPIFPAGISPRFSG